MNNYTQLSNLKHLLIDMDGVLWRGAEPKPGLKDFFALLRQRQIGFMLATNNASRTSDHYANILVGFGVQVSTDEIITSGQTTADYLAQRAEPGTPIYVIGGDGLHRLLAERGFRLLDANAEPGSAAYAVVSWDRQVTYEKLAQATLHIRAGAGFIATNPDRTWPSERGLVPGAGAIIAAVQAATDVEPTFIGKPSPVMLQLAMRRIGASAATTAMLGDRLETDILGGQNAGLTTILVLSGVASSDDLATSPIQPDLVFDDIAALTRAWRAKDEKDE
ncbi:MAG: HAD-IIA family hydrolase [Anaerolineae bacterium]|jgi:4-nitrophenyl phosphatase